MGILRNIGYGLTCPTRALEGVRARRMLFAGLTAIALVDARPKSGEEQALIEIGQRLCEASVNGTQINFNQPQPHEVQAAYLGGLIERLPSSLEILRPSFSEGCDVRFWRGRLEPDNDTEYVLRLAAPNGDWLILNLQVVRTYPYIVFKIRDKGALWTECNPC